MSQPNHDSKPSLPLATKRKECIHEFQCPNPMCMRPFDTQWGLSLHFHNSNNLFCNPSPQYRTRTEQTFTFKLPPNQEPCNDTSKHLGTDHGEDDDTSFPCWSDGDSNSVDGLSSEDVGDPLNAHVNDGHPADKKKTTGFGLAYTDAQYVETKLAKILNDIQAPKFVYSSVLKWAREAHTLKQLASYHQNTSTSVRSSDASSENTVKLLLEWVPLLLSLQLQWQSQL